MIRLLLFISLISSFYILSAFDAKAQQSFFSEAEIRIDTNIYTLNGNRYVFQNQSYLAFRHKEKQHIVELRLFPLVYNPNVVLKLMPSAQFEEEDSLLYLNGYYRVNIKFNDLSAAQFISLIFEEAKPNTSPIFHEIKLLPNLVPNIKWNPKDDDLFIGEIKQFPLPTPYIDYIRTTPDWVQTPNYDYKIVQEQQGLAIQLLPKATGKIEVSITPQTKKFFINADGDFVNQTKPLKASFTVKNTRLQFLSLDVNEVPLEFSNARGIEVQLEYNRNLQLKKTYRIEDQIESGGVFIGEIYTRSMLNNDKVLCWLRPFALHKISDGYLYLKDGDDSKFITNFNISPKFSISKVTMLRDGGDWSSNLSLNPGESAYIKIEGNGLNKANFSFEEGIELRPDTVASNENVRTFRIKVPGNIGKKKLVLYNNKTATGYEILVREFLRPRQLEFVNINYGEKDEVLTTILKPILYYQPINELNLKFNTDIIDGANRLYGKQYLTITVNLYNNRRELLESRTLDNVVVCPNESSPRFQYYDAKDCNRSDINLNNIISRRTYDLNDWARIEIIIKHKEGIYAEPGYTHRVELIVAKRHTFDVEVSFPGGLLIQKIGDRNFGNFGGVSLAILAQFSFYKPNQVEKLRPYKFGAGIIALNAFNFNSNNTSRDLGIVTIASLFPINRGTKLRFPLYAGFGYFVQAERWFYLVGPGIQVSF